MAFDIKNLQQRLISSVVIAPLALLGVYCGGWVYELTVLLIALLGLTEWMRLIRKKSTRRGAMRVLWLGYGVVYLGSFTVSMLYLRRVPEAGMAQIYYLFAVVWGTDIGAYAAGRLIGGPKLAPAISPNKTWAGLFGGLALACVFGYAVERASGAHHVWVGIALALLLACISQLGDLFESWIKRRVGVKESGDLIPGHGGILDRIDGLIFSAVFFGLFQLGIGQHINWW